MGELKDEVILDISRNLNTINIILIDEMGIDDFEEDGENSMKSDWSKIDVSQPNSFLLVAFNPISHLRYFRLLCTLGHYKTK